MKPSLESAISRLLAAARDDDDVVPFEDPSLGPRRKEVCRVISSPGGTWVLAPSASARDEYLGDHPGEAVFTAQEIKRIEYGVRSLSPNERREWVGDMVALKSVIPDAEVVEVRERVSGWARNTATEPDRSASGAERRRPCAPPR